MADRLCLQGILYVRHQDIAWQLLPLKPGFGSAQTCWRHLERQQQAGVFDQSHRVLLANLRAASDLDWTRTCKTAVRLVAQEGLGATVGWTGRPASVMPRPS
ncbi:transposase [Streptomyces sp. NPDC058284]|uniref:transposase n=1 Tax=unclassified Streptomyces TaxID=2593676 RepID=UPI003669A49B